MSKGIRLSEKHGVNPMLVVCELCGGDTGEIALLGRLRDDAEAPHKGALRGSVCPTCRDYMAQGVLLVIVRDGTQADPYRTGEIHVIRAEAPARMFPTLGAKRAAFLEESAARLIGLPKPEPQGVPK